MLAIPGSAADIAANAPGETLAKIAGAPAGIAVAADGTIVFADQKNGQLIERRADGSTQVIYQSLKKPRGVARAADGTLYVVAAEWTGSPLQPLPKGVLLARDASGAWRMIASGLKDPQQVILRDATHVAVSARERDITLPGATGADDDDGPGYEGSVFELDTSGALASVHPGFRNPSGIVYRQQQLTVAADAFKLAGSANGGKVFELDAKDNVRPVLSDRYQRPRGVVRDAAGYLYVAVEGDATRPDRGGAIVRIAPGGTRDARAFATGFQKPFGVALDGGGNLYVTDRGTGEIRRYVAPATPDVEPTATAINKATIRVSGRTLPRGYVLVDGGARSVHARADATGRYSLDVPLERNATNHLLVMATTDDEGGLNSLPRQVDVIEDEVAPQIKATLDPVANAAGWNNTDVTVRFSCTDDRAGVQDCPDPVVVSGEGEGDAQRVRLVVHDKAGNEATLKVQVRIDRTAPSGVGKVHPQPNAAGWNNRSPVTVKFRCDDSPSGVESCPLPVTVADEGVFNLSVPFTDKAGNVGQASAAVKLDFTPPVVTLTSPDGTLVYGTPAHVTGSLFDKTSGVAGVYCDRAPAAFDASQHSFQCDFPLVTGVNAVKAWAVDAAGNVGTLTQKLVLGPQLPNGDDHQMIATADINGDGKLDVVTTSFVSGEVSILLGNGDGTFKSEQRMPVGPYPSSVVLVDVTGDGVLDLVTTHYTTGEVAIFKGNNDGTFVPYKRMPVGDLPSAVAVVDVNGDGIPDIVTAHMNANQVHVFVGATDGTYALSATIPVGDGPASLAVRPLSPGRLPAIVTANFNSNDVSVLTNSGQGIFQHEVRIAAADGPAAIALADADGDGAIDIVTANARANSVSLLRGHGDGTFDPARSLTVGKQPGAIVVADVTGDRKPDLLTANFGSSDISILNGSGASGFAPEQRVSVGAAPASLAVIDAAGKPGLVATNRATAAQVIVGDGGGGPFTPVFDVLAAMSARFAQMLPMIVGPQAGDPVLKHHSTIRVRNLAPTAQAITITFVDESTGRGVAQYRGSVAANGSVSFDDILVQPSGWSGVPPGSSFVGAAVVSANGPIAASSSLVSALESIDTYDAVTVAGGGNRVVFPTVMANAFGFNSSIVVQNVSLYPVDAHVEFHPVLAGRHANSPTVMLQPGQSHTFRVSDLPVKEGAGSFWGSATVISSADPIAAVTWMDGLRDKPQIVNGKPQYLPQLRVYNGFTEKTAATKVYAPLYLVHADRGMPPIGGSTVLNYYNTELYITNMGTQSTEVIMDYSDNVAQLERTDLNLCGSMSRRSLGQLAPGRTLFVDTAAATPECKYVGSVTITSVGGQPLAMLVMQLSRFDSSSYQAAPVTEASAQVLLPAVLAHYGPRQRYTEITVQNVGLAATNVAIAFGANTLANVSRPANVGQRLAPGQTFVYSGLATALAEDYWSTATISADDDAARLAVVAAELPRFRDFTTDHLEIFRGHAPQMTPQQQAQGCFTYVPLFARDFTLADAGSSWYTGVTVSNPSDSGASYTAFMFTDSTSPAYSATVWIEPHQQRVILPTDLGVPAGANLRGSMVVTSQQDCEVNASIGNGSALSPQLGDPNGSALEQYRTATNLATSLTFPQVKNNFDGRSSFFTIQAGPNGATINATIVGNARFLGIYDTYTVSRNIGAFQSITLTPSDFGTGPGALISVPSFGCGSDLNSSPCVGSLSVRATQGTIAGISLEYANGVVPAQNVQVARLFSGEEASNVVSCPQVSNLFGPNQRSSTIAVQNTGGAPAPVTIEIRQIDGDGAWFVHSTEDIQPGRTHLFKALAGNLGAMTPGTTATVTISSSQPLLAAVTDENTLGNLPKPATYSCTGSSQSGSSLSFPSVKQNFGSAPNTVNTSVTIHNFGNASALIMPSFECQSAADPFFQSPAPRILEPGAGWTITNGLINPVTLGGYRQDQAFNCGLTVHGFPTGPGQQPRITGVATDNSDDFLAPLNNQALEPFAPAKKQKECDDNQCRSDQACDMRIDRCAQLCDAMNPCPDGIPCIDRGAGDGLSVCARCKSNNDCEKGAGGGLCSREGRCVQSCGDMPDRSALEDLNFREEAGFYSVYRLLGETGHSPSGANSILTPGAAYPSIKCEEAWQGRARVLDGNGLHTNYYLDQSGNKEDGRFIGSLSSCKYCEESPSGKPVLKTLWMVKPGWPVTATQKPTDPPYKRCYAYRSPLGVQCDQEYVDGKFSGKTPIDVE
jgi:hypothetical protein